MDNKQITIQELRKLQEQYDKLAFKDKDKDKLDYYSNLVNCIDDIINDLKEN